MDKQAHQFLQNLAVFVAKALAIDADNFSISAERVDGAGWFKITAMNTKTGDATWVTGGGDLAP